MTSIGVKLLRQVVVGIVAVMLVFGVLSVLRERSEEGKALALKEDRVLQQLDIGLENALWNLNKPQLERIVRSYLLDPDVLSIRVLENETVMCHLARVPGTDEVEEIGSDQVYAAPPGSHDRAVEIRRGTDTLGKVEVVFSPGRVGERLRTSIVTTTLALLVLVVVVSALVAVLVRRAVSRPLLAVVEAAERIAEGDVAVRLPEVEADDEIGALVAVFRRMVESLQSTAVVATRIAAGDLGGGVQPRSDADVLGRAFREMSQYLHEVAATATAIAAGDLQHQVRPKSEKDVLGHALQAMVAYLQRMAAAAMQISRGDLSQDAAPAGPRDVLGSGFERMSAYLREMASVATAIAAGDLRREVKAESPNDVLGNAFQELRTLRQMVARLHAESESLSGQAARLQSISGRMAGDSAQASDRVKLASATTQRISAKAGSVAAATAELAASGHRISRHTGDVIGVVQSAVQVVRSAQRTIDELDVSSVEIRQIVGGVSQIARQTNLLALNAEIEAARAGGVAKGLVVVAGRVRDLARQTAAFAEDISSRVESIQSRSAMAIDAINEVATIMTRVQDISIEISHALEEQVGTTGDISRMVAEAAAENEEVDRGINGVATVTANAARSAEALRESAQELAGAAARLRSLIERFKI